MPPSDIRALTAPPVVRSASSQQPAPAQGNIKRKRASLSAVEAAAHGVGFGNGNGNGNGIGLAEALAQYPFFTDGGPGGGGMLEPDEPVVRSEYGNPNKIAQLFPELALQ
jgi:glutamine amidotransferase